MPVHGLLSSHLLLPEQRSKRKVVSFWNLPPQHRLQYLLSRRSYTRPLRFCVRQRPALLNMATCKHAAPTPSDPSDLFVRTSVAILPSRVHIGRPMAFYAIASLPTEALLHCYSLSIGSLQWRGLKHPETLTPATLPLAQWSAPMNATAVVWYIRSAWAFLRSTWPQARPVTP